MKRGIFNKGLKKLKKIKMMEVEVIGLKRRDSVIRKIKKARDDLTRKGM